jgi:prepilin-type N-terminal cleavage/methylation domain-containing protein
MRKPESRIGHTLIEIVVALFVFSIGALALAASSAEIARAMGRNGIRERAARIASNRVERARSECGRAASGSETDGIVASEWAVSSASFGITIVESVTYLENAGMRTDVYRGLLLCRP